MSNQELSNLLYLFFSTMITVGAEYLRRRTVEKERRERDKKTARTPKYPKGSRQSADNP